MVTHINSFTQFKALQIPEPVDTQTSAINAQEAEAVSDYNTLNEYQFQSYENCCLDLCECQKENWQQYCVYVFVTKKRKSVLKQTYLHREGVPLLDTAVFFPDNIFFLLTEQKCIKLHWRIKGPHCSVWAGGETVIAVVAWIPHEHNIIFIFNSNFLSTHCVLCVFSWTNLRTWSPSMRWPLMTSTTLSLRQSWTRSNIPTGPTSPLLNCKPMTEHSPHNKSYVF